jgi:hypothetical protein
MNTVAVTPEKAVVSAEQKAIIKAQKAEEKANAIKAFTVEIHQEGFSLKHQLVGKAKDFTFCTKDIVRNITGKLYSLMLIRKVSGQKCGISLSKEFNFTFTTGTRTISTMQAQTALNLKLKVGYKAERRRMFETVLTLIIDEVMAGNNLYTDKDIEKLNNQLTALTPPQAN